MVSRATDAEQFKPEVANRLEDVYAQPTRMPVRPLREADPSLCRLMLAGARLGYPEGNHFPFG